MKRRRLTILVSVLTVLLVCFLGFTWFARYLYRSEIEGGRIEHVMMMLQWYMHDTGGRFPPDAKALEERGFLKELADGSGFAIPAAENFTIAGEPAYCSRPYEVPRRDIERIRFGTSFDDLCISGDQLVDRRSGEEVLLVQFERGGEIDKSVSSERSKQLFRFAAGLRHPKAGDDVGP